MGIPCYGPKKPKTELEKYEDELHQQINQSLIIHPEISSEEISVKSDISDVLEIDGFKETERIDESDDINNEEKKGENILETMNDKYIEQLYQYLEQDGGMDIPDILFPYSSEKVTHVERGEVLGREMIELTRGIEKFDEHYWDRYMFVEASTGKPLFVKGTHHIIKHNDHEITTIFEGKKYYQVSLDHNLLAYVDNITLEPLAYKNRLIHNMSQIGEGKYLIKIYPNKEELKGVSSLEIKNIIINKTEVQIGLDESTYIESDENFIDEPHMYSKEYLGENLYEYYQFGNELEHLLEEEDFARVKIFFKYFSLLTESDKNNIYHITEEENETGFMESIIKKALLNIHPQNRLNFIQKYERYLGGRGKYNFLEDMNKIYNLIEG